MSAIIQPPLATENDITDGSKTNPHQYAPDVLKAAIEDLAVSGTGDMAKAIYDPNTVEGDAFDMDNMVEGAATKVLTDTERTKLAGVEAGATGDQDLSGLQEKPSEGAFVDGDKTKLDGVEAGATADQTDAEIRAAVDAATDSNVFTDSEKTLLGNQSGTNTGDQDLSAYQLEPSEGEFVDGDKTKLDGIESGGTGDQTGAEIKIAYEGEPNTNAYTDSEKTKLGNQSGTNTGDQDLSAYQLEPAEGGFVDGDKTKLDGIGTVATATETTEGIVEWATQAEVEGASSVDAVVRAKHLRLRKEGGGIVLLGTTDPTSGGANTGVDSVISGSGNYGNSGNNCSISGESNHSNSGEYCQISGESNRDNTGNYCSISGSGNSSNSGWYCQISGFFNHTNSGRYCSISGYGNQYNEGENCIIGGENNTRSADPNTGTHSIIGGRGNYGNDGDYCSISGWNNHSNTGNYCSITGLSNYSNDGTHCSISGFYNHTNTGNHCQISGKYNSSNSGDKCSISGFYNHTNSGYYSSISGAYNSSNSGNYCQISGFFNSSNSGWYCSISGKGATNNTLDYARVHGGGTDARIIDAVAKAATTDATPTTLTLGGAVEDSTNRINIPTDTSWLFVLRIVAKDSSGAKLQTWTREGLLNNNGGTTSLHDLVGLGADRDVGALGATIAVTADDTNNALKIVGTGVAVTAIDWAARIEITQVG